MTFPVGRTLFSAACVGIIVYGVIDYLTNYEQNKCQMTYMFELPEYIGSAKYAQEEPIFDKLLQKIPVILGKKNLFPKYGLYAYGEGEYARFLEKGNYQGIPVLFIPGNLGSHKQARSLGSVAMRRQMDKQYPFLFNYFTVDFHEELSGIYGGVLKQQTEFVHFCIKRILKLYKDNKPKSVILVGHSMGGMIARALFTLPDFDHSLVNTIITQATPHQEPVLALDRYLSDFYNRVNQYWREYGNTKLSHVTVVSTGGGPRDLTVRNGLTSLQGIVNDSRAISTSTTAMPLAWVSTDHLCAVWCKQVVLATKRSMFDIVDLGTRQVSLNVNHRMSVFRHHFLQHPGTRKYVSKWKRELTLDDTYHWIPQDGRVWEVVEERVVEPRYLVVPISEVSDQDSFVAISNVMSDDWICACELKTGEKRCKTCINLSDKGQAVPPFDSGRKVVHLNLLELKSMTHILLIVPKSYDKVEVMGDLYRRDERHLSYRLPDFYDILMTYPESVTRGSSVLTLYNDTLYYNLYLTGMSNVLKAFHVELKPKKCHSTPDLHDGNMMSLHFPWSNEDVYSFYKLSETGNMTIKLQNGISLNYREDVINMKVYVDPACTYLLRIIASPMQMLGQLMRFYGPLLPGYLVSVEMMGLIYQLMRMAKEKSCPSLLESVGINGAPYRIMPLVIIISLLLSYASLDETNIFWTDIQILEGKGLMSVRLIPLCLYSLTLGVVNFHCFLLDNGIKFLSRILGFVFSCCSSSLLNVAYKAQIPLLLVAVVLSAVICGPLGLLICYFICIVKVFRTSYLASIDKDEHSVSRYNYYFTILLLMMPTVVINLPTLVMWFKQVRILYRLEDDPSSITSVCCVLAMVAIFICDNPLAVRDYYVYYCWLVQVLTVLTLLYCTVLLYRIPYVTITTLAGLAIPQVYHKIQSMTQEKKNL